MNNLIIVAIVFAIAIGIGILGNSNYEQYVVERDQRNLQASVADCKNLFSQGIKQDECITKSIDVFGTEYQKAQWEQRLDYP
ncbi:MAG: hypothetical protein ACE5RS_05875 [Nitrosopumilus sp.]|nr:hypothetical protein [Nitrosopumilus sp.]